MLTCSQHQIMFSCLFLKAVSHPCGILVLCRWITLVYLPRLAQDPGSCLGKWKMQGVPGKRHFIKDGHGVMIKKRARRSHSKSSPTDGTRTKRWSTSKTKAEMEKQIPDRSCYVFCCFSVWTKSWWASRVWEEPGKENGSVQLPQGGGQMRTGRRFSRLRKKTWRQPGIALGSGSFTHVSEHL